MLGLGVSLGKSSFVGGSKRALDDYASNIGAAYSLRRLLSSYSGAAVRVRNISNGATGDVGFTSNGDLDVSALQEISLHSGSYRKCRVTKWYDQSSNARHIEQTQGASQPLIMSGTGSTYDVNSKPSIPFEIAPDGLSGEFLSYQTAYTPNFNDHLLIAVHKNNLPATKSGYLFSLGYNDAESMMMFPSSASKMQYRLTASSATQLAASGVSTDQLLSTCQYAGANQKIFINGSEAATQTFSFTKGELPDIGVGYAPARAQLDNYYQGDIQELIYIDGSFASSRNSIQDEINTYYNIY